MDEQKKKHPAAREAAGCRKGADEGSAIVGYHEGLKKSRRGVKASPVRVVHPTLGTVEVEGGSKLIAIQNAARVWGKKFNEISRECEVWRTEGGNYHGS